MRGFADEFFTPDGTLLYCSNHAAEFQIEDGFCVSGPCEGESLKAVKLLVGPAPNFVVSIAVEQSEPGTGTDAAAGAASASAGTTA